LIKESIFERKIEISRNYTAEMARLAPLAKDGGYIPSCDHGVPPDVSWPAFIEYGKLLAKITGWK